MNGNHAVAKGSKNNWITVLILASAVSMSIMDRAMLNLLIEPIKRSIHLSDTQIAIVSGVSFGLFYCIFALIMGPFVDHGNRRKIIVWTMVAWSTAMFLTGLARSFIQLTLCRIGLAIGEAALAPASYSIIADLFPRRMLGRAISTFYAGSTLGPGLALVFGGGMITLFSSFDELWLPVYGDIEVWQAVLMTAAVPGFLVATLVWIFISEPTRKESGSAASTNLQSDWFLGGVRYLVVHRKLYGPLFIAMTLISLNFVATLTWTPTYLIRVHAWNAPKIGFQLGMIVAVSGVCGAIFGGWLADWLTSKGHRDGLFRSTLIMGVLSTPFAFSTIPGIGAVYLLFGFGAYTFCVLATTSTVPALLQVITPNRLRGQVSAVYLTILNIAALAVGPLCVALLTDYVFRDEMALGYSLTVVSSVTTPFALVFLWLSKRPLQAHLNKSASP